MDSELVAKYTYDSLNRLVREDNYVFGKSYTYKYDQGGNIKQRIGCCFCEGEPSNEVCGTDTFQYAGSGWKDQLISYNGKTCTYDALGNLTQLGDKQLTWTKVRKLASFGNVTFTYDAKGMRTGKSANGVTRSYIYEGDLLLKETFGNNTITYYQGTGGVIGFNYNGTDYFYRRNLQGDVVAIYTAQGTLVAKYVYDAWGNHKVYSANNIPVTDTSHIGYINPIRYRGYYYDVETKLYYCQARYYSPELCRWISADAIEYLDPQSINGLNLYAYCGNDPINKYDPSGHFAITLTTLLIGGLIAGGIGAGIGLGTAIYKDVKEDGVWFNGDWTDYVGRTLGGFVAGFGVGVCTVLGAGVGAAALGGTTATLFTSTGLTLSLGSALGIGSGVAFATGMAGYAVRTGISRSEDFKVQNMFIEGGFNAVSGALSVLGGYLGGMAGVHNTVFTKLLSQKGDFWLRLLVGNVFTAGFKLTNALIKPYFMI